jgi:hypothetical protein
MEPVARFLVRVVEDQTGHGRLLSRKSAEKGLLNVNIPFVRTHFSAFNLLFDFSQKCAEYFRQAEGTSDSLANGLPEEMRMTGAVGFQGWSSVCFRN